MPAPQLSRSNRSRSAALASIGAWFLVAATALLARPDVAAADAASESEPLLLAFKLRHQVLQEVIPAYRRGGDVLLPLGETARLLELGIEVDAASGVAEGFIVDEARTFRLDTVRAEVALTGAAAFFDPARVEVRLGDIYVAEALLERWLPIEFHIDPFAATVTAVPREPLPMERREARRREAARNLAAFGYRPAEYPSRSVPYRLLDGPFADLGVQISSFPDTDGRRRTSSRHSVLASGDLLYMETLLFLSGTNSDPLTDSRLSLARRDPAGGLLGPLRAREIVFGETFLAGLDLVGRPASGPGVLVSSFPLHRPTQFDARTFRGDVPPGWDVELYRNGGLIDFQRAGAEGVYEFSDVPLLYGENVFRTVFYGPHGERREETREFNIGEPQTGPGELHYRAGFNQPEHAGRRSVFQLDAGLSRHLSATMGFSTVELADGAHAYAQAGLRGSWSRVFATLDYANDRNGGSLVRAGVQTRIGGLGISAQHARLDDFESEVFSPVLGPIDNRTSLRLDWALPAPLVATIPMSLELRRDEFTSGQTLTDFSNRIALSYSGFSLSNQLRWLVGGDGHTPPPSRAFGSLLANHFGTRYLLRGRISYDLEPRRELTDLDLTVERRLADRYLLSAGYRHTVALSRNHYLLGLSKTRGAFAFGLTLSYSDEAGLGALLSFKQSLVRDPSRRDWRASARPVASMGAASVRVFLDADNNGVFDLGEEPLEGVAFAVNGVRRGAASGVEGIAFLERLPSHIPTDLAVSPGTLEDPLLMPRQEGIRFVPRPGKVTAIDFPILSTGEITGTVYLEQDGETREAAGVAIELVDQSGEVVEETRTAFDGFYYLTRIHPGHYRLRVSPAQAERLRLAAPPPRRVRIEPANPIIDGLDLVVQRTPVAGAAAGEERPPAHPLPPAPAEAPLTFEPSALSAAPEAPRPSRASSASPASADKIFLTQDWAEQPPAYVVQLASYRERESALRHGVQLARKLGVPRRVARADLGSAGEWHRVLVGEFASPTEAHDLRNRLESAGVVSLGPVLHVFGDARSPSRPEPREAVIYAVQLAAYREEKGARAGADKLAREFGQRADVLAVDLGELGVWYRVLMGGFSEPEDARAFRSLLHDTHGREVGPVRIVHAPRPDHS